MVLVTENKNAQYLTERYVGLTSNTNLLSRLVSLAYLCCHPGLSHASKIPFRISEASYFLVQKPFLMK